MPTLKNIKHEKFCLEYHKTGNGYQAAVKAGFKETTARVQASQLLTKLNIQNRLDELREKAKLKYGIDMEDLVNDLKEIQKNELGDYNARLKAIDMQIKIVGEYAPAKQDHTTKGEKINDIKVIIE